MPAEIIHNLICENQELKMNFEVEKNIKNNLYSFILESGMFNRLVAFSRSKDMSSPGGHDRVISLILSGL